MRTGTFHTFDRYISSEHTSFLVYKGGTFTLLSSFFFLLLDIFISEKLPIMCGWVWV